MLYVVYPSPSLCIAACIGLGVVIVISVFFMLFALRHPMALLRESMGAGMMCPLLDDVKREEPLLSLYRAPTPDDTGNDSSLDRKSYM